VPLFGVVTTGRPVTIASATELGEPSHVEG